MMTNKTTNTDKVASLMRKHDDLYSTLEYLAKNFRSNSDYRIGFNLNHEGSFPRILVTGKDGDINDSLVLVFYDGKLEIVDEGAYKHHAITIKEKVNTWLKEEVKQ